jgi:hypothetical protein
MLRRASEIVVNADDVRPLLEQTVAQVGAEKSGSSSDQDTSFEMQLNLPGDWPNPVWRSTPKQISRSVNIALPDRAIGPFCRSFRQPSATLSVHTEERGTGQINCC